MDPLSLSWIWNWFIIFFALNWLWLSRIHYHFTLSLAHSLYIHYKLRELTILFAISAWIFYLCREFRIYSLSVSWIWQYWEITLNLLRDITFSLSSEFSMDPSWFPLIHHEFTVSFANPLCSREIQKQSATWITYTSIIPSTNS